MEQPFHQGFRINTLKIDPSKFFDIFSLECQQSTFAKNAYILKSPLSLGNEIFHKQGLIYIQEASAASVVDLLDIQKGDKVLDPFVGSGTALRVCQQTNRRCIGIDINPVYIDLARGRLSEKFTGF